MDFIVSLSKPKISNYFYHTTYQICSYRIINASNESVLRKIEAGTKIPQVVIIIIVNKK